MSILKLRADDAVTGFFADATASALITKQASTASSSNLLTKGMIASPSSLLLPLEWKRESGFDGEQTR